MQECFESMINGLANHLIDNQHFESLTLSMIGIESAYLDPSIHGNVKKYIFPGRNYMLISS